MATKIVICMGSSCFARGNAKNLKVIEEFITRRKLDAEVLLSGSCCEGKCAEGPNIVIDGERYPYMERGALVDVLNTKFGAE